MEDKTGGPAFAAGFHRDGNSADQTGMSLRDYIAIHAPAQEVIDYMRPDGNRCRARYEYADAMLAERNK